MNDQKEKGTLVGDAQDILLKNLTGEELSQLADLENHEGWSVLKTKIAEYVKGMAVDQALFGSTAENASANVFTCKGMYQGSKIVISFVERARSKVDRKKKK